LRFRRVLAAVLLFAATAFSQTQDFTVVALPDTQHYSKYYPAIYAAQTRWIVQNAAAMNIQFVLGLGDIVDDGEQNFQWQNADAAVRILDQAGMRYAMAIGNHDYMFGSVSSRDATLFNQYFGPLRYHGRSYYRGSYPAGSNENFWTVFDVAGVPYLVMLLETFPRDAALNWAASVLAANRDKQAIIVTHSYMFKDNSRIGRCDSNTAASFGVAQDNDGDQMWSKFVSRQPNVFLVLNGHTNGAGRRADIGTNGNLISQVLADYQDDPHGGNGWLRILKFRPALNLIEVRTYSPYLNQWLTDSNNQFTLKIHDWPASSSGALEGRVRSSSCAPLSGVTISAGGHSTVTGAQGLFSLPLPAPAAYTATAAKSGWKSGSVSASVPRAYPAWADFFLASASPSTSCTLSSVSPSVTICAPTASASVSSPVRITGGATSSAGVRFVQVYVDGLKAYEALAPTLDTSLPILPGTHRLTVQAGDKAGAIFKQTIYITVK